MTKYEIMVILKPHLDKDVETKLINNIETKLGGTIVKKEDWGLKEFSYVMKKDKEGHYILYYLETDSSNLIEFNEWEKITKDIIRTLVLKHEKKFPFERRTSKEIKFPERKPRTFNNKPYDKKPYDKRPSDVKMNENSESKLKDAE